MKLYTFHKVARPLTDYLNLHNIPFLISSNNKSLHFIRIPLYDSFFSSHLPRLIENSGLQYSIKSSIIFIF